MGRRTLALLAVSMGTIVAFLGVELWARSQPLPRIQQFHKQGDHGLQLVDGIATWHGGRHQPARWNLDCTEQGPADVVLLGSSIFYGVRLDITDTLGHQIAGRLGTEARPACVVNLAQPGSAFENQDASAKLFMPKLRPKVVVWEVWHNSANTFTLVGDAVYNFGWLQSDRLGVPNPLGLPPAFNRLLFGASAAYRYVNLTRTEEREIRVSETWSRFVDGVMAPAVRRLRSEGAQVLLAYAPKLDRPFAQNTVPLSTDYRVVEAWAQEEGVPTVDLAAALGTVDPSTIGLDTCCHLNEEGTRLVAGFLADQIRRMNDAP